MNKRMLALVAPYFGTLPAHFQLWLNSCAMNPEVDWLLYTDDRTRWDYPDNVRVRYCTLGDLRDRFQERLGFRASLPNVKKLGDYKPLYGYLFEDELLGYQGWGHIDVGDIIYGNVGKFVTPELIERYDRLGYLGHLAIYRNTPENNRRFMSDSGVGFGYREVFTSPTFYNFEEVARGSIDEIWRYNGWSTCVLDDCIADLSSTSFAFRVCRGYGGQRRRENNRLLIFEWNEGRLLGHEMTSQGEVGTREFLYVHFKRRRMPVSDDINPERYLISPLGFSAAPSTITPSCLKELGKGKFPDPMWVSAKWANAKQRMAK